MGKAQSKRSVDITTEVKKDDVPEEGTGKMGKIEDVDQLKPQVNGDTHHNENNDAADKEKSAETEATENEKDLSTEKEQTPAEPKPAKPEGGDDATAVTTPTADKPVENGNDQDETLNESKNAADTSTVENGDSSKKPKKEKVKKKWSIRSISFGKKDKQKPPKKEEPATNGECEKVPEEASADDAAKNGKATAEEATAATSPSEEKSPATSPTTAETKEVSPVVAAVTAAVTEVAPVVNGSSEPAKDEKPVAEVAPTIVAEEKVSEKVENAVVEEPPKIETAPVVAVVPTTESSPAPESAKIEETPAPAKIEVKAESIQGENIENKLEATQVASDPPQQGDIDKMENKIDEDVNLKNIHGDSESAQNLPPPPLPCTSPPSQVSVFALSDVNKDNVEDEQSLVPPPVELESSAVEAVPESKDDPIPEPVVALAAADSKTDETPKESQEVIEKVVDEPAIVPAVAEISAEPPITPTSVDENVVAASETIIAKTTDASSEIVVPEEEIPKPEENVVEETVAASLNSAPLSESSPVNQEQIAETVALIDEVTKEAVVSVSNQLESPISLESPMETSEPIAQEQQASSNNVEPDLSSPITAANPVEDKPAALEQSSISESSGAVEDTSLSKEQSSAAQALPDSLQSPNTETKESRTEHIGDHGELAQSTPIEEPIVDTDVPVEKTPVEDLKLSANPPAVACETEEAAQVAKTKENGFGDNHATETSATESLNGVDHKAIEEIKTDCSEKMIGEPTTELVAATVEVKE